MVTPHIFLTKMQVKQRSFSGRRNLFSPEKVTSCHVLAGMNYPTSHHQIVSLNRQKSELCENLCALLTSSFIIVGNNVEVANRTFVLLGFWCLLSTFSKL